MYFYTCSTISKSIVNMLIFILYNKMLEKPANVPQFAVSNVNIECIVSVFDLIT